MGAAVCAACGSPRPDPDWPSCQACGADGAALAGPMMTRTELAMLWDLLGTWQATHPNGHGMGIARRSAANLQVLLDVELAERFGG